MSEPRFIVEFDQVTKTFGSRWRRRRAIRALDSVTLAIPRGEIFGLLGPNRAGKSTFVKILLSICRPTSGRVTRLGRPARDRATLARVGYLHDSQAFPGYLTARETLAYYGALSGLPRAFVRARGELLLERVGLADRSREPIRRFSKGMAQRLALAQALLGDPELLVLDEPAEGMDLLARDALRDMLVERRALGHTTILVSHGVSEIRSTCDRVAVMREGRVAFEGRLADLDKTGQLPATESGEAKSITEISQGEANLQASLRALYGASHS